MFQVGMKGKKTPCKPENVLGKTRFIEIKTKSDFQPIDKPKEQHKRAALPPQN
jgi:hypothetical protein